MNRLDRVNLALAVALFAATWANHRWPPRPKLTAGDRVWLVTNGILP